RTSSLPLRALRPPMPGDAVVAHPVSATSSTAAVQARKRYSKGLCSRVMVIRALDGDGTQEFCLTPGAIDYLSLQLAAGSVDVVTARASNRRQHARIQNQLLEGTDVGFFGTLIAGARERVERNQVDLAWQAAHQLDQ